MLKRKERQLGITDIEVLQGWCQKPLVPKESIYHGLAEADDIFRDELFASAYSSIGRPATSPGMLTKVLLLQFHDNASDRQAEEHALYDLRWKHALHLSLGESGFDYSTLSVFRTRLLLSQTDNVAFQQILDAAADRGMISREAAKQIFDSTHTLGAGAVQDTYTLIRKSIIKLVTKLQKRVNIFEHLPEPLRLDYQDTRKPKIDWNNPAERNQLLNDLVHDAFNILAATEGVELTREEQKLKDLLSVIAVQDIVYQADGKVTLKQGVAKDRIISTTDPEMRHGRKSSSRRFDGYKTNTAMDNESEFITAVVVTPGNAHDSEAATQLIDSQPEGQRPGAIIGDTAYGTGQVRADMEERHIQVIAPAPAEPQRPGHFPKSAFQIDLDTETCRCPGGQTAAEQQHSKSGQLKAFAFSQEQCGNCPLKGQCTQSKHNRRIVTVHPQEKHLQEARAYQKTKEFAETYPDRHKVERKQAEMTRHGVRKARYIGQAKVQLQALVIAALVNFKRYWKLTTGQVNNATKVLPVAT